jgi:dTDP-4-dehydrorhamnose reductase
MARTLIHQLRATVLALREIRDINPRASFIQNEDLGKVHSTPRLADEARYQNERRWLTFDVLCGRVDDAHPMWPTLREGVSARELERFLEDPLVPDVLGVDHYVTSERYLDEALAAYPDRYHGGNAIERYADAEAVWSLPDGMVRFEGVLRETWDRYGIPLAITEAHLNGTREEQIRWLVETWEAALAVRADGADVRAVTAWSLFGAYDWPTLLTEVRGFYESGAFDLRGPEPRRTALADMMSALASSGPYAHPVLAQPGWWRRPERLIYGPSAGAPVPASADDMRPRRVRRARPIAFVADGGVVTDALRTALEARALAYEEIDVLSGVAADLVADVLSRIGAWAVVDAATFASAFDAAFDEDLLPTRTLATDHVETVIDVHRAVASVAAASSTPMVALSSWLVFAGADNAARDEATRPDATSAVGRAWIDTERTVVEAHPSALVARLGPALGSPVTPYAARDDLRDRPRTAAVTPTFLGDAANAALDLLLDRERGIWHLANVGLAPAALASGVRRSVVLASGRGVLLPPLEDALRRLEEARLPLPVDGRDATVIDEIPA